MPGQEQVGPSSPHYEGPKMLGWLVGHVSWCRIAKRLAAGKLSSSVLRSFASSNLHIEVAPVPIPWMHGDRAGSLPASPRQKL